MSTSSHVSAAESIYLHPLVKALGEPAARQLPSPLYLLCLGCVAILMLALPLVYVGLIGVVSYGVYLHAVNDAWILTHLRGRAVLFGMAVYVGVIVVGVVGVLFMIKPIFAPRSSRYAPLSLNRRDEPLLFAFVDRLSDVVGSPKPARIDLDMRMNASASFRGLLSGLIGGQVVLTVGLPLAAGMNVAQLTGVLAHEFGHFAQRGGMRLTYLIQSVNIWFARVVYERDRWDEMLEECAASSDHWSFQLFGGLARLFVWINRRILHLLMLIGHFFSSIMLRQMEFDADKYTTRVIGSAAGGSMLRLLPLLDYSTHQSFEDVNQLWKSKRLPASVPDMIAARLQSLSASDKANLEKAADQRKAGWFDSHPTTKARIAAMAARSEKAVFVSDAPASCLFTDFSAVSRLMTSDLYRGSLGRQADHAQIIEQTEVQADKDASAKVSRELVVATSGLLAMTRPVFLPAESPEGDDDELAAELMLARSQLTQMPIELHECSQSWEKDTQQLRVLEGIAAIVSAGEKKVDAKSAGLAAIDDASIRSKRTALRSSIAASRKKLDEGLSPAMRRFAIAVELDRRSRARQPRQVQETYDIVDHPDNTTLRSIALHRSLSGIANLIDQATELLSRQFDLCAHASQQAAPSDLLRQAIMSTSRKLTLAMKNVAESVRGTTLPNTARTPLQAVLLEHAPVDGEIQLNMSLCGSMIGNYRDLYARTMFDLLQVAAEVERDLGLSELEAPPG